MKSVAPGQRRKKSSVMNASRGVLLALGRLLLALRLHGIAPRFLKRLYWQIIFSQKEHPFYGSRMVVPYDLIDMLIADYEPGVAAFFNTVVAKGMTFCDVGANIGIFSLLAAKLVGPTGRVIAVEPVPGNAAALRKNIALNPYKNIQVLEKAVSDLGRPIKLHLSSHGGSHSIFPDPANPAQDTILVESVRLDSLPGMDQVHILKIDVEGAELSVLRSLGEIRPDIIVLEYHAERTHASGNSGPEFLKTLQSLGYCNIQNLDDPVAGLEGIQAGTTHLANLALRRA